MAPEQYFHIHENNEWRISFKGGHYGPHPSQEKAIDAAHAMGEIGINAQDESDKFETR
jgi:hypothetical protein